MLPLDFTHYIAHFPLADPSPATALLERVMATQCPIRQTGDKHVLNAQDITQDR